ncbi:hypothetical protein D3C84_901220 [compost metagenome]
MGWSINTCSVLLLRCNFWQACAVRSTCASNGGVLPTVAMMASTMSVAFVPAIFITLLHDSADTSAESCSSVSTRH